jgi:hypothetical protein
MPALHPIFLPEPASSEYEYDVATTVAANTLTTVLSYTNPFGGSNLYIDRISAEGEVDGCFTIVIDTGDKDTKRSSGGQYTVDWQYPNGGLILAPGSIIDIKVEHGINTTADFSAALFGHRF